MDSNLGLPVDGEDSAADLLSNSSNNFSLFPYGPKRDSLYLVVPMTIVYTVVFITGVVGNVVTCIVIARNKYMHTATNYYLFSLAISDLLLLVSGLPQEMVIIWYKYPYLFGEVFCVLRGLFAETSTNATVLTITAFTVERYVAICHPFLAQTMSKLSRAVKLIVVIWLVALSFAIPQALQFGVIEIDNDPMLAVCSVKRIIISHSFELSSFLFFITPMTLITVLYALIGVKLRKSNMIKRDCGSFYKNYENKRNSLSRRHQPPNQSSRRVLKMLVAVVVAFFICWAPFHAQRLVYIYGSNKDNTYRDPIMNQIYHVITYISGILYYVSTTINPILYHIMSLKFREAFKSREDLTTQDHRQPACNRITLQDIINQDTIARCCGLPTLKNRRGRRSYSILNRSDQPGALFGGAYSHSTDNSNNSVRDDSLPSTCLNSAGEVIATYPIRYKSRRKTTSVSEATDDSVKTDITEITQRSIPTNGRGRRQYTVVLRLNNAEMNKSCDTKICWRKNKSPDGSISFWSVFKCIRPESPLSKKRLRAHYYIETTPYEMQTEYQRRHSSGTSSKLREDFAMGTMRRSFSNNSIGTARSNEVSNSSLKDYDKGALQDELTLYMEELLRNERFVDVEK